MRKLLIASSVIALILPATSFAATAEELAAQIQALLQQVTALQQQVGAGVGAGATNTVPAATPASVPTGGGTLQCPLISRNLKRGMSGVDVTRLQQFLALDPSIYPEAQVTGYYGGLTEAAVQRFQCKNKLVCDGTPASTGYGVTGPRTAALLALQCPDVLGGNTGTISGFMRVTPVSGAAPLNVAVETILNTAKSCAATTFEIAFGDGSVPANATVPAGFCNELRQVFNHLYTAAGTYILSLRSGVHQSTVTVTVGDAGSGGTPTTPGQTGGPFNVTAGANGDPFSASAQFDIASSCDLYDLDWGDNSAHAKQTYDVCKPGTVSKSESHTYQNAGSYTITLKRGSSLQIVDTVAFVIVN